MVIVKTSYMNKIIAAFDGLKFSTPNMEMAIQVAKSTNAHLTGIFLDDRTYTSYRIYELVLEDGVSESKLKQYRSRDTQNRLHAAALFEEHCQAAQLEFNVHHDKNVALQELLHESIFSDLLIVNRNESFTHHEEKYPTRFIRDLLSDTQCPVLLTPENTIPIEKIIFLYDGDPASVYAIKMFNHLFPQYQSYPAELFTVKRPDSNVHLPDHKLVKEFMKRHYTHLDYTVKIGDASEEIVNHLQAETQHCCVVLGAYRRTMMSRWFRSSMADALIQHFDFPLFIAHNK